jgi:hypothetical protein
VPVVTTPPPSSYDIVLSNGGVHNYAGAQFYGSKAGVKLPSPIVAGATTADGGGYWLVSAKGAVYRFGDATNYGQPKHVSGPVVAMAVTPDGQGYWIVTKNGGIYNFGDAAFCGSPVHQKTSGGIVSFAPTPDGQGYWMLTGRAGVLVFGDATFYGSAVTIHHPRPAIAIVPTPDGAGYFIATGSGNVYHYGDAGFFGSPVHEKGVFPFVGFAATADGEGYWFVNGTGRLFNYGDASFHGSLAHTPPKKPTTAVAVLSATPVERNDVAPFPHGILGYDISNYQCKSSGSTLASPSLPPVSAFSIIEVAGWLDSADNSCLASEVAWANNARVAAGANSAPYDLYLFLNSPDTASGGVAASASGPAGTCAQLSSASQPACIAYNYGYNGGKNALAWASHEGASSAIWWIDVENSTLSPDDYSHLSSGEYWSHSTALNDETIQGAIDALRSVGALVGMYSTSVQYPKIAGNYVPSGARLPLWIAGAPWTSPPYAASSDPLPTTAVLTTWCAGTASYTGIKGSELFAAGVPWLLQETPGVLPSPYNIDPDYAC